MILNDTPSLNDLHLDFGWRADSEELAKHFLGKNETSGFFHLLSQSTHTTTLRRLSLAHLNTRKEYLRKFLRCLRKTLEFLVLDNVSIEYGRSIMAFLYEEMTLKEVTLRCLNCGGEGYYFDEVNLERPVCVDAQQDWVVVNTYATPSHEITLNQDDGDDVKFWLRRLDDEADGGRGEAWTVLDFA